MSIRWMSAVWQRSPYKGERLLLHLALADFANDEGTCFPSVRTLALKARCSEQWARKGIQGMIDDGLLEIVERGLGRGNVNRYRLLSRNSNTSTELTLTANPASAAPDNPNSEQSHTYLQNRHEPITTAAFEEFWTAYPRKVGKGKARAAFAKVMERSDAPTMPDLLAAVQRYAASVTDERYLAHPTTWLNGERWTDELPAPAAATAKVAVPQSIGSAIGLGNAFALTGRTMQDLLDQVSRYPDAERTAAIDAYNRTNQARRSQ